MASKRPLIYLGVVIIIAVIVFLVERPDVFKRGDVNDSPVFPGYDAERITRIEVGQLMSGVRAKLVDKKWMVANLVTPLGEEVLEKDGKEPSEAEWYSAEPAIVGRALGVFGDLWRGVVVSNNPEKQSIYQVKAPVGLEIKMFEGDKKVVDMIVGKRSPDLTSTYFRVGGSDEVMLSDRDLAEAFPTALSAWRDHTIWRIDPEKVVSVEVSRPKGEYELVKEKGGDWVVKKHEDARLDQEKVRRLIASLSFLRADGFSSKDDPRSKYKKPALKLEIEMDDDSEYEIELGGSNNLGQSYARLENKEQVYLIKGLEQFIPEDWKVLQ